MITGKISIINIDKLCKTCKGTGKILVFQPRAKVKVCPECKVEPPAKAPVTPPTTLPKEGEFISALNALDKEYLSTLHALNKVYSNELTFRVLSAHNRDMKRLREENADAIRIMSDGHRKRDERIVNLVAIRDRYETLNLTLSEDLRTANQRIVGLEDRIACQIPALQQVNKKLEGELSVSRLANESLRKQIVELQAQVPRTVKPKYGLIGMYCPNCGLYLEKHWKACHCGAKLDWLEEKK